MQNQNNPRQPFAISVPYCGNTLHLKENSSTAFDEPQIWLNLTDKTSLEITHEIEGLPKRDQFYSIRHHCSNTDFDNGKHAETCGIISTITCAHMTALTSELDNLLRRLCASGVQPIISDGKGGKHNARNL